MLRKTPPTHDLRTTPSAHGRQTRAVLPEISAQHCAVLPSPVVLVVSEDSLLRWALYEALAAAHFRVLTFRDEAHAREILPKVELQLSLAIVDDESWAMTRSARDWLRERWPHLPILVLAHPAEGLEDRVAELDLAGVLVKPFDVSDLLDTVARIVTPQAGIELNAESVAAR